MLLSANGQPLADYQPKPKAALTAPSPAPDHSPGNKEPLWGVHRLRVTHPEELTPHLDTVEGMMARTAAQKLTQAFYDGRPFTGMGGEMAVGAEDGMAVYVRVLLLLLRRWEDAQAIGDCVDLNAINLAAELHGEFVELEAPPSPFPGRRWWKFQRHQTHWERVA